MKRLGRRLSVTAALVLLGSALSMPLAGEAAAQTAEPVVVENVPAIAEHTVRGGGTAMSDVGCGSVCAELWTQEQLNPSSQLVREQVALRQGVGVLPRLSLLSRVTLAGTALTAGVWIGDLANDKYFRFNKPAAPAAPNYTSFSLVYLPQGTYLGNSAYAPESTFYLEAAPNSVKAFKRWTGAPSGSCSDLDPHPDLATYTDHLVGQDGCAAAQGIAYRELHAYTLPDTGFEPAAPIEDYTGQPYEYRIGDWPGEPPNRAEIEERVRQAVESGEYPMADAWWAHQLDPQTYSDPTEDEEQLRDCRPTDQQPAGDPSPLRGTQDFLQDPDRWRARYDIVPTGEFPPGSGVPEDGLPATGGRAYMRWGWAALNATKPLIDWEGWGYRHIVAKHGWGPTALARTEAALLSAPLDTGKYDEYVSPTTYASRSGKLCEWVVIVQRDPNETSANPELSQQAPMGGIITAHGRWVR